MSYPVYMVPSGDVLPVMFDTFDGGTGPFPASLVDRAERLFAELLSSSSEPALIHGDLHHYNILSATRAPWLAIDPKGVVAEREFELGPLLRNPHGFPELYTSPAVIRRRLTQLCTWLQLDYDRALRWGLALSVLSAIWDVQDTGSAHADSPALLLAYTIDAMLG